MCIYCTRCDVTFTGLEGTSQLGHHHWFRTGDVCPFCSTTPGTILILPCKEFACLKGSLGFELNPACGIVKKLAEAHGDKTFVWTHHKALLEELDSQLMPAEPLEALYAMEMFFKLLEARTKDAKCSPTEIAYAVNHSSYVAPGFWQSALSGTGAEVRLLCGFCPQGPFQQPNVPSTGYLSSTQ